MPLISTKAAASAQGFGEFASSAAPVYIEDVFSTYLYIGNGSTQTITNGIALGDRFVGTSTYFNGSAYLSRSSDLSGNADGKTFTFSVWVYVTSLATDGYIYTIKDGTTTKFLVGVLTDGRVNIQGFDNIDGSRRLNVDLPANSVNLNQWTNILISFDLTSTSTRFAYVNDVAVTPTYSTYQNYNLDFTANNHYIAALSTTTGKLTGYATNLYVDYTYRDLSVTANRRYFIDANGCSTPAATLTSLSPILYLPLTTSTTTNAGTGGSFTANSSPVISDKGTDFSSGYGKGGLVWLKGRSGATDHALYDTARGSTKDLVSNSTSAQTTESTGLTAFSGTGFSIGALAKLNTSSSTYASWTFRKQAKFFDVVTWTGDNVNGRVIPHSLNAEVGFIVVKAITTSANDNNWVCRHRSQTSPDRLYLNTTAAASGSTNLAPTTTGFTVYANGYNETGVQYVAYLFAHNAGGFGLSGTDNVISCGSWTGTGTSPGPTITLGWEPQLILYKCASGGTGDWGIHDNMRSLGVGTSSTSGSGNRLEPNTSDAETGSSNFANISATGFTITPTVADINASGSTYIYIAIRRGPMKVPTSGTSVFSPVTQTTGTPTTTTTAGFPVDLWIEGFRAGGVAPRVGSRLIGADYLETSTTNGTQAGSNFKWDSNTTVTQDSSSGLSIVSWMWRRAPGFFDVVCDTGTGSAHTITHNLGVVPELMIRKKRSAADAWIVYANNDNTDYLVLNTTAATVDDITMWNDTSPTSSVFTVGTNDDVNGNTATFVTYLFATLAGVSKVGSYTGTGTTLQIDCGFTGGARFVLIKRTDSTGDWYVWDTARGIVSGNDPYLLLNSTAAEVTNTDYVDTYSAGFELSSTAPAALNANGGTFIFLAIA